MAWMQPHLSQCDFTSSHLESELDLWLALASRINRSTVLPFPRSDLKTLYVLICFLGCLPWPYTLWLGCWVVRNDLESPVVAVETILDQSVVSDLHNMWESLANINRVPILPSLTLTTHVWVLPRPEEQPGRPRQLWMVIHAYCFKQLNLGVTCYTAIANCYTVIRETKLTLIKFEGN